MQHAEDHKLHAWVTRWKKASHALEEIRRCEIIQDDLVSTIEILEDAFHSALCHYPPSPTSGLVEQQYWFNKLRP